MTSVVERLIRSGVRIPAPGQVHVGEDVDPARIEAGAVLHPGARLSGRATRIGRGSEIGSLGPALLRDCAVGRGVDLGSGAFEDAVFLDGAGFGPSGHARAGVLFEEGARAAHAVGVKQTILLPYATLGSLINFCDCLLAGGTGPEDHSEVGSGFIHFNFSPSGARGDKATPSLFGDVVSGVFLRENRIFLGGDAGAVGPVQVGFGTVLAAGSTYRRDRGAGVLAYAEHLPDRERPFDPRVFRGAADKVRKNVDYLAQLAALRAFYDGIRRRLAAGDAFAESMADAAIALLDAAAVERVKHLARLGPDFAESAARLAASEPSGDGGAEARYQSGFGARIEEAKAAMLDLGRAARAADAGAFAALESATPRGGGAYPPWAKRLPAEAVASGKRWLQSAADAYRADPEGAARL